MLLLTMKIGATLMGAKRNIKEMFCIEKIKGERERGGEFWNRRIYH